MAGALPCTKDIWCRCERERNMVEQPSFRQNKMEKWRNSRFGTCESHASHMTEVALVGFSSN